MPSGQPESSRRTPDELPPAEQPARSHRRPSRGRWLWLVLPVVLAAAVVLASLRWFAHLPGVPRISAIALADGSEQTRAYRPFDLRYDELPYHDQKPVARDDGGLHDDAGVRMFKWQNKGEPLDHPVAQAQWGLLNLNTYRTTGDTFFLDRAIANAQRNVDRKVESRGGWWYPYEFDLTRCENMPIIPAPWYSAMSQGQLISLFVRLYETTKDEKWRTAAERTFTTFMVPAAEGTPWGVWTDPEGQVWLEEYPMTKGIHGERVLNGHIFAMYGVYDYWRMTQDPRAANLFNSAAETVRHYVPKKFQNDDWASNYSMECNRPHLKYHQIHIGQMLKLYQITGDPTFASYADQLRADYPAPKIKAKVRFAAGTHVGYRFDEDGKVLEAKTLTVSEETTAPADERIRIRGGGIHYRITGGPLSGWYVPEKVGERTVVGRMVSHTYTPLMKVTFQPGDYTGNTFGRDGRVAGSKRASYDRETTVMVSASAWVNGVFSYQISSGPLAKHWVPQGDGIRRGGPARSSAVATAGHESRPLVALARDQSTSIDLVWGPN